MVLKFEDYIKEGFINKTLKRVRKGDDRTEDKHFAREMCKFISQFISDTYHIPYSDDLCVCMYYGDVTDSSGYYDNLYKLVLDLSRDGKYPDYKEMKVEFFHTDNDSEMETWMEINRGVKTLKDMSKLNNYKKPNPDFEHVRKLLEDLYKKIDQKNAEF